MSTIQANLIEPSSGTTVTFGASGDTVAVGSGATTSGFAGGLASVQTFTSSGTWTRPSGITKVIMKVQGGGGGGGGGNDFRPAGGGGGGGGYSEKFLDVSSISTSTITIGAAGTAGAAQGSGGAGGDSSWADGTNTITGSGGSLGAAAAYPDVSGAGGAGGSATNGDVNIPGQYGMNSNVYSNATDYEWVAWGGDSILGFGGRRYTNNDQTGKPGQSYGGGGSGGRMYGSAGGAGSQGIVIVWEYK